MNDLYLNKGLCMGYSIFELNRNNVTELSDKDLMNAKYEAIEIQNGYLFKLINKEISRRNSE